MAAAFGGTYDGKSYEESGAKPWDLTDQQKEFLVKDKVRHVLIMKLESTEAAVRWNNKMQALAENSGFGMNFSGVISDERTRKYRKKGSL